MKFDKLYNEILNEVQTSSLTSIKKDDLVKSMKMFDDKFPNVKWRLELAKGFKEIVMYDEYKDFKEDVYRFTLNTPDAYGKPDSNGRVGMLDVTKNRKNIDLADGRKEQMDTKLYRKNGRGDFAYYDEAVRNIIDIFSKIKS